MNFIVGLKFLVNHREGGSFTIELIEEPDREYFLCYWEKFDDRTGTKVEDSGHIKYHASDMRGWISRGMWNITIINKVTPVFLDEELFTL